GRAYCHDVARVLFVVLRDEAPAPDGEQRHRSGVLGLGAANDQAFDMLILVTQRVLPDIDVLSECGRNIEPRNILFQVSRVIDLEVFARADFGGKRPEAAEARRDAADEKGTRAERLDAVLNEPVQPVDDGGHRYHAGHADHDAEYGERGADLARAK